MLVQKVKAPEFVTARGGRTQFHLANPRPFWYEAHCMLHEPLMFDEDLTGRLLIVETLAGAGQEFYLGEHLVLLLPEGAVLAVFDEGRTTVTKDQLKTEFTNMLDNELESLSDTEQVTDELLDNVDAAVSGILDRAHDDNNTDEDEEDDEESDAEEKARLEGAGETEDVDDKEERVGDLKGGGHSSGSNTEAISSEPDALKSPNRK